MKTVSDIPTGVRVILSLRELQDAGNKLNLQGENSPRTEKA
jgi:hypothetical protein